MNKLILPLFCLLFVPLLTLASESQSIRAELKFKTNLGFEVNYVLQAKGYQLRINGFEMSKDEAFLRQDDIHRAVSVTPPTQLSGLGATCSAGTYEHVVVRGNSKKIEQGCIEEKRFAELQTAYERLQAGL